MRMTFDKGVPLSEQRLAVAKAKCVRKHGKRHRTGKRKSQLYLAKKAKAVAKIAKQTKTRSRFLRTAAAYWAGDADTHPV